MDKMGQVTNPCFIGQFSVVQMLCARVTGTWRAMLIYLMKGQEKLHLVKVSGAVFDGWLEVSSHEPRPRRSSSV